MTTTHLTILLALAGLTCAHAGQSIYVERALQRIADAEKDRAEGLAFMKKHPDREDLPGKPYYSAFLQLAQAEGKLDRAEKKGESVAAHRKRIQELRETYAAEYFEFISPLILELARKGKERYVWSAMGTIRDIEKHVSSGPSAELTAKAKEILAKGGEAEVEQYLREARRLLKHKDFDKAKWNAQNAARLAKTDAQRAEAEALVEAVAKERAALQEQRKAAGKNAKRASDLLVAGKFREAAELYQADRRRFRDQLVQCKGLEPVAEIADIHEACAAIRKVWKKGLIWKQAYWVNRYTHSVAYGFERIKKAEQGNANDPALVFEKVLLHFALENYPTVDELIAQIEASAPGFKDARGVSIATYREAIDTIQQHHPRQSDYRTKRNAARSNLEKRNLDARYAATFSSWKRGIDVFLKAF